MSVQDPSNVNFRFDQFRFLFRSGGRRLPWVCPKNLKINPVLLHVGVGDSAMYFRASHRYI